MNATKHLTKAERIRVLSEALGRIERECRGYDTFSTLGILGSVARGAVLEAGETVGETLVRLDTERERRERAEARAVERAARAFEDNPRAYARRVRETDREADARAMKERTGFDLKRVCR